MKSSTENERGVSPCKREPGLEVGMAALKALLRNPGFYCSMQLSVCVNVSNSSGLVLEEAET